ncbi:hypothetical protein, partial [Haemophilus influenzae]
MYASKLAEVCSDSMNIDTGKDLKGFDSLK